jgi:hypothetical protein
MPLRGDRCERASGTRSSAPTSPSSTTRRTGTASRTFADAWRRHKEATGRLKDRESLPRLRAFRDYWLRHRR